MDTHVCFIVLVIFLAVGTIIYAISEIKSNDESDNDSDEILTDSVGNDIDEIPADSIGKDISEYDHIPNLHTAQCIADLLAYNIRHGFKQECVKVETDNSTIPPTVNMIFYNGKDEKYNVPSVYMYENLPMCASQFTLYHVKYRPGVLFKGPIPYNQFYIWLDGEWRLLKAQPLKFLSWCIVNTPDIIEPYYNTAIGSLTEFVGSDHKAEGRINGWTGREVE